MNRKQGFTMRQDSSENPKGKNEAAPRSSTLTNLSALATALALIHPGDILAGAQTLAIFAGVEMADSNFTAGYDTHSEAEELAYTVMAVLSGDPKEFANVLPSYVRLLGMVRQFSAVAGNAQASAAIDRISIALTAAAPPSLPAVQPLALRNWFHDKAVIVAAIALGLLIWDISSDGLMLWQIIAAILLVGCICGAAFRTGQRLQTPVLLSGQVQDKGSPGRVDR
jgi:hypothetical protein